MKRSSTSVRISYTSQSCPTRLMLVPGRAGGRRTGSPAVCPRCSPCGFFVSLLRCGRRDLWYDIIHATEKKFWENKGDCHASCPTAHQQDHGTQGGPSGFSRMTGGQTRPKGKKTCPCGSERIAGADRGPAGASRGTGLRRRQGEEGRRGTEGGYDDDVRGHLLSRHRAGLRGDQIAPPTQRGGVPWFLVLWFIVNHVQFTKGAPTVVPA